MIDLFKSSLTLQQIYDQVKGWYDSVLGWLPDIVSDRDRAETARDEAVAARDEFFEGDPGDPGTPDTPPTPANSSVVNHFEFIPTYGAAQTTGEIPADLRWASAAGATLAAATGPLAIANQPANSKALQFSGTGAAGEIIESAPGFTAMGYTVAILVADGTAWQLKLRQYDDEEAQISGPVAASGTGTGALQTVSFQVTKNVATVECGVQLGIAGGTAYIRAVDVVNGTARGTIPVTIPGDPGTPPGPSPAERLADVEEAIENIVVGGGHAPNPATGDVDDVPTVTVVEGQKVYVLKPAPNGGGGTLPSAPLYILGGASLSRGQQGGAGGGPTVPSGVAYEWTGATFATLADPVGSRLGGDANGIANAGGSWPQFGISHEARGGVAPYLVPAFWGGSGLQAGGGWEPGGARWTRAETRTDAAIAYAQSQGLVLAPTLIWWGGNIWNAVDGGSITETDAYDLLLALPELAADELGLPGIEVLLIGSGSKSTGDTALMELAREVERIVTHVHPLMHLLDGSSLLETRLQQLAIETTHYDSTHLLQNAHDRIGARAGHAAAAWFESHKSSLITI